MGSKKNNDVNYYEILDLTLEATSADIRKAYKRKALKCHPDKNPDNPKAAELFLQLSSALEVLLDESARSAYDKLLKAKEAAKLRHKALDEKRKRFKEDLEARERDSALNKDTITDEEKLRREVERLQKEGARLVQNEIKLLQEQLLNDIKNEPIRDVTCCQLKVKWDDKASSQYTEESLRRIFRKYGDITALVKSGKMAIIEFQDSKAAELAAKIEVGYVENPLTIRYANSKVQKMKSRATPRDSESLNERSSRQAEERQRLIEEMMRKDAEES